MLPKAISSRHERLQLLATVADLYYVDGRGQAEIARRLGYSRSTISRLLTEARETGVVEIRIHHPLERSSELESALMDRFGLQVAQVAVRGQLDYTRMLRQLGRLGAAYLSENLTPTSSLGVSWGTAVYEVAQAFRTRHYPKFRVVQMIGAVGASDPTIDGHDVARRIATKFGGTYHTLNAPLIVGDVATTQVLLREPNIRKTLAMAAEVDYALVGIGSVEPETSSLVRAGFLSAEEMAALKAAGVVGDMCARHFDIDGQLYTGEVTQRLISIDLRTFINRPIVVVAVAGGIAKARSILGALNGGLVDVLITDSTAAEAVLRLADTL